MNKKWMKRRKRLFEIIEIGSYFDRVSKAYDYINITSIIVNLVVSIMLTYQEIKSDYGNWLMLIEEITIGFFAIDYVFRLITAKCLYPEENEKNALKKYIFSFSGVVDLLSFLPYYLPIFLPAGTVAFRMIRIVRILRLFRINAYHDSISVITEVLSKKKQQLISSVFIILVLMIASSLCMYSLEHEAQPDVFQNAFSGIWWAASSLLTVGYGDIYPITFLGKLFGIFITFLGVGMVAIPTGIISAGFVDQYSSIKKKSLYGYKIDMHFIRVVVKDTDRWAGMRIADTKLASGMVIAVIKRKDDIIIPRGDIVIQPDDVIIIGAEPYEEDERITLKELIIQDENPWCGKKIRDLDLSRHSVIVMIKRKNKSLIPNGNMVIQDNDRVFMYTQKYVAEAKEIDI